MPARPRRRPMGPSFGATPRSHQPAIHPPGDLVTASLHDKEVPMRRHRPIASDERDRNPHELRRLLRERPWHSAILFGHQKKHRHALPYSQPASVELQLVIGAHRCVANPRAVRHKRAEISLEAGRRHRQVRGYRPRGIDPVTAQVMVNPRCGRFFFCARRAPSDAGRAWPGARQARTRAAGCAVRPRVFSSCPRSTAARSADG